MICTVLWHWILHNKVHGWVGEGGGGEGEGGGGGSPEYASLGKFIEMLFQ